MKVIKLIPCCVVCCEENWWSNFPSVVHQGSPRWAGQTHTCRMHGPKTRYAIFKALLRVAREIHFGRYRTYAESQRDHLIARLAAEFPDA